MRLVAPEGPDGRVALSLPGREIAGAWRCDARERDLGPLEVRDGRVELALDGAITSVRLVVGG